MKFRDLEKTMSMLAKNDASWENVDAVVNRYIIEAVETCKGDKEMLYGYISFTQDLLIGPDCGGEGPMAEIRCYIAQELGGGMEYMDLLSAAQFRDWKENHPAVCELADNAFFRTR